MSNRYLSKSFGRISLFENKILMQSSQVNLSPQVLVQNNSIHSFFLSPFKILNINSKPSPQVETIEIKLADGLD